ncbi:hypothetical protein WA026_005350 [Henosepilachna vigintioctopunctata]|uniref:Uncharacterized protein n=1 Tax=Henosepilachna vigintioctopunctata TaxID=420089 RepID=A0AAW1U1V6_9CUCU
MVPLEPLPEKLGKRSPTSVPCARKSMTPNTRCVCLGSSGLSWGGRCVCSGAGGTCNREGKLLKNLVLSSPPASIRLCRACTAVSDPERAAVLCSDEEGKPLKPEHSGCVPSTAAEERRKAGYLTKMAEKSLSSRVTSSARDDGAGPSRESGDRATAPVIDQAGQKEGRENLGEEIKKQLEGIKVALDDEIVETGKEMDPKEKCHVATGESRRYSKGYISGGDKATDEGGHE